MAHIKNIASDKDCNYIIRLVRPGMHNRYYNETDETWDIQYQYHLHNSNGEMAMKSLEDLTDFSLESYGVIGRYVKGVPTAAPRAELLMARNYSVQEPELITFRNLEENEQGEAVFGLVGADVPGAGSVAYMVAVMFKGKLRYAAIDSAEGYWTDNSFFTKTFSNEEEAIAFVARIMAAADTHSRDYLSQAFPFEEADFDNEEVKKSAFFAVMAYTSRPCQIYSVNFDIEPQTKE